MVFKPLVPQRASIELSPCRCSKWRSRSLWQSASAVRDILGRSEALTLIFDALCISGKRIGRMEEERLTILCQSRCPERVAAVGCLLAFKAAGCLSPTAPALDKFPSAAGESALNPSSSTFVPSSSANVAHEISPPIQEKYSLANRRTSEHGISSGCLHSSPSIDEQLPQSLCQLAVV